MLVVDNGHCAGGIYGEADSGRAIPAQQQTGIVLADPSAGMLRTQDSGHSRKSHASPVLGTKFRCKCAAERSAHERVYRTGGIHEHMRPLGRPDSSICHELGELQLYTRCGLQADEVNDCGHGSIHCHGSRR